MKQSSKLLAIYLGLSFTLPVHAQSATFYGDSFVGRKMANGVRYHHGKMIAAHPSLPLGTQVKVMNRRTKKSVIVTIADRCNCSIDLSRSAFGRIAKHSQGRVFVKITRL